MSNVSQCLTFPSIIDQPTCVFLNVMNVPDISPCLGPLVPDTRVTLGLCRSHYTDFTMNRVQMLILPDYFCWLNISLCFETRVTQTLSLCQDDSTLSIPICSSSVIPCWRFLVVKYNLCCHYYISLPSWGLGAGMTATLSVFYLQDVADSIMTSDRIGILEKEIIQINKHIRLTTATPGLTSDM